MTPRHPVFCQIYVTGALLAFVGSFVQLYEPDADRPDSIYRTMNLWTAVGVDGAGAGLLGLLLIGALVLTAMMGATGPAGFAVPVATIVIGAIGIAMLVVQPQSGSNPPSFGPGAQILLGTSIFLVVTAIVDALTTNSNRPVVPLLSRTNPRP
ncbi:hypothetical protein [Nocardioides dongxiaopingii]|uniref:hypothetical protein n=1 Tax=Nocardioides dongxiaopingii TaxID=2576036 RepID=UPI0010C76A48|nr:hypothetical protein [Nocardioides dongxiaopingii]